MSPDGTRDFPLLESGVRLLENSPYFTKDCHLVSLQFSRREPTVGGPQNFHGLTSAPFAGSLMKILYLCSDLGIPVLGRKGASVHVRGLVAVFVRAGYFLVLSSLLLYK